MKRIALKIDVDTYRGTKSGVPALIELLQRHNAQATFFFALGPDHSGRDTGSESLRRYYDFRSRLYGRFLPGPEIGRQCGEILQRTAQEGFETGIHAWNRSRWENTIDEAENAWVEAEMRQSSDHFSRILGTKAQAHAAAGWRMNRHALRLTQRHGFAYASDCRGNHPFLPAIDGELIGCVQIPTTLPTFDELLAQEPNLMAETAATRIAKLSAAIPGDHVFTLRAELEGIRFLNDFEHLVKLWQKNDFSLVSLRDIHDSLEVSKLPRHVVGFAEIPGRQGWRLVQGDEFLSEAA